MRRHRIETLVLTVTIAFQQRSLVSGNSTALPSPISLVPTGQWDDVDKYWSSFWFEIGTPPQNVRLLPSTSGNTLWPILPQGCTAPNSSDCGNLRGGLFNPNKSSTWNDLGLYYLATPEEQRLDYEANTGDFGMDNVSLGLPGSSSSPVVSHQVIGGIATSDFYNGIIGLSPNAINLTNFTDPHPSFLTTLKNQGLIPSLTWGYTAGSYLQQPPAFGSLTLGGYDSSRRVANEVSFPFGQDANRELLIGLENLSSNITNTSLLATKTFFLLDSLVQDLWLPVSTCKALETLFGLTYDTSYNYYAINKTSRSSMLAKNPSLTFKFRSENESKPVTIQLSYSSLDLTGTDGLYGSNGTLRFPIRQAQNTTQLVLGRVLFQETFVIADYERRNFSISQTLFPQLSSSPNIVAISPPDSNATAQNSIKIPPKELRKGAVAGIIVGAVCLFALTIAVSWLVWWRKRRTARRRQSDQEKERQQAQRNAHGFGKAELSGHPSRVEIGKEGSHQSVGQLGDTETQEMCASIPEHELPTPNQISELPNHTMEA